MKSKVTVGRLLEKQTYPICSSADIILSIVNKMIVNLVQFETQLFLLGTIDCFLNYTFWAPF